MSEHSEQTEESEGLLPLERRTYLLSLASGATATGGAAGGAAAAGGVSQEEPTADSAHSYEDSWVGYGRGEYSSGLYGDPGPPPLPESNQLPEDLDGDGLFEDVDGDGAFDIFDVQTFFNNFNSNRVQRYAPFFDFNNDGEVTIFDVQNLFNRLQQQS
jgi:PKD repeat protein